MKLYQCHKKVKAAQLKTVGHREADGIDVILDDDTVVRLATQLTLRYTPQVGDYLVEYDDGYRAISPQKAFEDGYTAIYAGEG